MFSHPCLWLEFSYTPIGSPLVVVQSPSSSLIHMFVCSFLVSMFGCWGVEVSLNIPFSNYLSEYCLQRAHIHNNQQIGHTIKHKCIDRGTEDVGGECIC